MVKTIMKYVHHAYVSLKITASFSQQDTIISSPYLINYLKTLDKPYKIPSKFPVKYISPNITQKEFLSQCSRHRVQSWSVLYQGFFSGVDNESGLCWKSYKLLFKLNTKCDNYYHIDLWIPFTFVSCCFLSWVKFSPLILSTKIFHGL